MSMPIAQAQVLVRECIDSMRALAPGGVEAQINGINAGLARLEDVRGRLLKLIAGGYRLERLQSTLLLCAETIRKQQEMRRLLADQRARMLQLSAGLNEVL